MGTVGQIGQRVEADCSEHQDKSSDYMAGDNF